MKHSFEKFCKDYINIENYEKAKKDNFKGWQCHHRIGVDIPREKLKALGMYYNRPAEELIFLTTSEHAKLHSEGRSPTDETRRKMSEALKGEKHPFYGKHHSEETRKKMREAQKGRQFSEETRKKMSEAHKDHKGKHWYNNGKENKFCFECPDGFIPGRIKRKGPLMRP